MEQDDLLSQWLRSSEEEPKAKSDILEAELTPGQRRLYFLHQVDPSDPYYHYTEVYRPVYTDTSARQIDKDVILQSFLQIVEETDILRTIIENRSGTVRQRVVAGLTPEITEQDVQSYSDEQVRRWQLLEATRPLSMDSGPLVRLSIAHENDRVSLLQLTMHHIITDKWSMRVLRQRWSQIYRSLSTGSKLPTSATSISYLQYAHSQASMTTDSDSLAYWKERLSGAPDRVDIEHDYARPSVMTHDGAYLETRWGMDMAKAVERRASEMACTPYSYLLAAFLLALHKHAGQDDIVIGSPVSNRDSEDLEQAIGFFNETVLIRSRLDHASTIESFVKQMHEQVMGAFAHRDVPFEELVSEMGIPREANVNPLFQQMFLYHEVGDEGLFDDGVRLHVEPLDLGVAKFDLTLYVSRDADGHQIILEYSTETFARKRLDHFLASYKHIVGQMLSDPAKSLTQIEIIAPDTAELLQSWEQGPSRSYPYTTVIEAWSAACAHTPEAQAVSFGNQSITHADLDRYSRSLAARLLERRLQGSAVGILAEPGIEMIIAIWAVLRAGAHYVPLDPSYPWERLDFMIKDSGVALILCDEESSTGESSTVESMTVDRSRLEHVTMELPLVGSEEIAYIIYTSGSSGRPKGVPVQHSQLYYSTAAREVFYEDAVRNYLLLSSFSFDSSVAGIFWTLTTGACLTLVPRRSEQDLMALGELIAAHGISHTLMLPSLYELLLDQVPAEKLRSLRVVVVAGEASSAKLIQRHHQKSADTTQLVNEYGPTENTVWSTAAVLKTSDTPSVPIGGPVANTGCIVLDSGLKRVPLGTPGQLAVYGSNLTEGYHNRPELTASKFVRLPWLDDRKVYLTGDRVKWRSDGQLAYLGRVDQQIKLRGYRIELAEIEQRILSLGEVSEAVVQLRESGHTRKLVCYYTSAESDHSRLETALRNELPGHMIPDLWHQLPKMPRLPNGKVDRQHLASLQLPSEQTDDVGKHSWTKEEGVLRDIWQDVLGIASVSVDDNFFQIGGDSMMSIQILARSRAAGLAFKPQDIFTHQTIRALSQVAEPSVELVARRTGQAAFLPIHQWFFDLHQQAPEHWGHAYQIRLTEPISQEHASKIITRLLEHHDALRSRFDQSTGRFEIVEATDPDAMILLDGKLSMAGAVGRGFSRVHETRMAQLFARMSPSQGGLFKLLATADDEAISEVILVAHHLVVDALSWSILLEDLSILLRDPTTKLATLSTSILDWADKIDERRQVAKASTENFKVEAWQLQQSWDGQSLERDVKHEVIALSSATTLDGSRQDQHVVLAAISDAVMRAIHKTELVIDVENLGRSHSAIDIDVSRTVGWFTSMYSIKLAMGNNPQDYLRHVVHALDGVMDDGIDRAIAQQAGISVKQHPYRLLYNYLGSNQVQSYDGLDEVKFLRDGLRSDLSERQALIECNVYKTPQGYELHLSHDSRYLSTDLIASVKQYLIEAYSLYSATDIEAARMVSAYDIDVDLRADELDALFDEIDD